MAFRFRYGTPTCMEAKCSQQDLPHNPDQPMFTSRFQMKNAGGLRISDQSKRYGRPVSHVHRFLLNVSPTLERYSKLVLKGHAYRPHYAYAMLSAAFLARH